MKISPSRSRSISSNDKDFNSNSFRIINGHVFSFQNELLQKKLSTSQTPNKNPPSLKEVSEENSMENSSLKDHLNIDELDLISKQKLSKLIPKKTNENKNTKKKLVEIKRKNDFEETV